MMYNYSFRDYSLYTGTLVPMYLNQSNKEQVFVDTNTITLTPKVIEFEINSKIPLSVFIDSGGGYSVDDLAIPIGFYGTGIRVAIFTRYTASTNPNFSSRKEPADTYLDLWDGSNPITYASRVSKMATHFQYAWFPERSQIINSVGTTIGIFADIDNGQTYATSFKVRGWR